MLLFLIRIELLTQKILSSTKIQRISLGTTSVKVSHYADDLTLFISTPLLQFVRSLKNFLSSLALKSTNPKAQLFLTPQLYYLLFVLPFHKVKFFHPLKFLKLISFFKIKICQKTGMISFAFSLILLFPPSILKTYSFPKLSLSTNISSPKYYSSPELFHSPLNKSNPYPLYFLSFYGTTLPLNSSKDQPFTYLNLMVVLPYPPLDLKPQELIYGNLVSFCNSLTLINTFG